MGELSDDASSARYLACCFNYKHSAEQLQFWHGLITTIGLVNYQVSRHCVVANCCSDKKCVGGFADIVLNGTLFMPVGQSLFEFLPPFLDLRTKKEPYIPKILFCVKIFSSLEDMAS